MNYGSDRQQPPKPNSGPRVVDLVIKDLIDRAARGASEYGTPLQPNNGRDALADAYQEALDLATYLRQALEERDAGGSMAFKSHWSEASKSLVMRLRGIYAIGPNADQMGPNDKPDFGWRTFDGMPPIQFEAAARIEQLEEEIERMKEAKDDR